MIETIYNSENSENKTADMSDGQSGKKPDINIRLPKNIRQIGQSDITMNCQIYIEENILFYIKLRDILFSGLIFYKNRK